MSQRVETLAVHVCVPEEMARLHVRSAGIEHIDELTAHLDQPLVAS